MSGPNGEQRRESDELVRVVLERLDRIEDRAEARFDDLAKEIQLTRHGGREALTMVTEQLVANVQQVALLEQTVSRLDRSIAEIDRRTSEDGPIDRRFRRHDARLITVERSQATTGRYTWGDVAKVIGALVGAGTLLTMLISVIVTLAPAAS